MNNETKDAMIASIDAVEVINDFITDWWSVTELYESSAKAVSQLVQVAQRDPSFMTTELRDYINQHIMMIDLLKEVTRQKGGEL